MKCNFDHYNCGNDIVCFWLWSKIRKNAMEILNVLFLTMAIKNLDNNSIVQLDILFKAFVQHLAKKNSLKPISW
jgi:hypothetical protein